MTIHDDIGTERVIPCVASERDARDAASLLGEAAALLSIMPAIELERGMSLGAQSETDALTRIDVLLTPASIAIRPTGGAMESGAALILPYIPPVCSLAASPPPAGPI